MYYQVNSHDIPALSVVAACAPVGATAVALQVVVFALAELVAEKNRIPDFVENYRPVFGYNGYTMIFTCLKTVSHKSGG